MKKVIIKELQKRLKNHHTAIGKQTFSLHCSEDAFVSVFKSHITRYSPCGSFYFCSFKGETSFDEIGQTLGDENWGERNYGKGQLSFVRLYVPGAISNDENKQKKEKLEQNYQLMEK